eukprot:PRCOL_00002462-RA
MAAFVANARTAAARPQGGEQQQQAQRPGAGVGGVAGAAAAFAGAAASLWAAAPALAEDIAAAVPPEAADAAAQAASTIPAYLQNPRSGALGPLVGFLEDFLKVLESGLETVGVPYAYGWSIVVLTLTVKAVTFPLTKTQVESSLSMQRLQPQIKAIQARNQDNKEAAQQEIARLYRDAGVNPLAGCLPTLATIPVFIALYRAFGAASVEGYLDDAAFYFIPSLGGPTNVGGGTGWLFPLVDGHPPLGPWEYSGRYLILPAMLLVSQYATQALVQPPANDQDESQKSTLLILKFLPLMIAWFSLNVPAGLGVYWFTNNIVTTGIQLYLKQGGGAAVSIPDPKDLELKAGTAKRSTAEDREARESKRLEEQEARRARFAAKRAAEEEKAAQRNAERDATESARKAERAKQAAAAQKAKEALESANAATAQAEVAAEVAETVEATFEEVSEEGEEQQQEEAAEVVVAAEAAAAPAAAEAVAAAPPAAAAPAKKRRKARRKKARKNA